MSDIFDFNELKKHASDIGEHAAATVLHNSVYQAAKVAKWSDEISKITIQELQRLSRNFKYVVSCLIVQRLGAGLNCSASAYWDDASDAVANITWKDDDETLICIISVFGMAI
uniref:Dynein light chain Tctex-type 1 n=1 Tax=Octactis speculum TaxID=3111310 RepID=A0A7S2GI66_9STRA|mmetsp:Transcript_46668/g.63552  ORF Transcript_46668/g.63552 Transcript_46668/m.63552 type:complete len:113 (+) Transcript_46668:103-441(+)